MKIQKSFLKGWRDSYVRMSDDAYAGIAEALFKDMPPVPISEHPSKKNLVRRALGVVFKEGDDDFWREYDIQDATSWVTAQKLSKSWVKVHPECAPKHEGLRALLAKMNVVGFTGKVHGQVAFAGAGRLSRHLREEPGYVRLRRHGRIPDDRGPDEGKE